MLAICKKQDGLWFMLDLDGSTVHVDIAQSDLVMREDGFLMKSRTTRNDYATEPPNSPVVFELKSQCFAQMARLVREAQEPGECDGKVVEIEGKKYKLVSV